MGRTACTEPQCLYKGALYLLFNNYLHKQITERHKKRELLKNQTKIEEIQEKKILTEIEPLQLAF